MYALNKVVDYLDESMQRSIANASHQLVAVGAIAFLGFIFYYWVWAFWFPQPYETLPLRLIGSFLGLGLMLTPYWPIKAKQYLPWYWFLTIFYTLAFFFAFSFLMNQGNYISAMALLCSVFLLVLLVDLLSLFILLFLGWGTALLCYCLFSPSIYFGIEHLEISIVLFFVILAGSTVNYKTAMLQEQRMAGVAATAGMIAHELRTPLLSIRSGSEALLKYMPVLLQGYHQAKNAGLMDNGPLDKRLGQLNGVCDRLISEVGYANTIIDMLLVKAGKENLLENCELELCSMQDCLQETMQRYPFKSEKERGLLSFEGDFKFIGSKLLMQHVLFNLIKNALYMIATVQKGDIRIWTETTNKGHFLYFKDTAKGMSKKQLTQLFNHFYTTTFMGTGIGLSFCKMVMRHFGGNISCDSIENEYTLFTLYFPFCSLE